MKITPTHLPEVLCIEPRVFHDERGFFLESWNPESLRQQGLDAEFIQDNHSRSAPGVLRGLHYQIDRPQGKLVRVVSGAVFDVAVDLRRHSPRFGQWVGLHLSAENHRQLWIPPGFAHGFYVTSAEPADFLYKTTAAWSPAGERCLRWNDPALAIDWPIPPGQRPQVAEKDRLAPDLSHAETYS